MIYCGTVVGERLTHFLKGSYPIEFFFKKNMSTRLRGFLGVRINLKIKKSKKNSKTHQALYPENWWFFEKKIRNFFASQEGASRVDCPSQTHFPTTIVRFKPSANSMPVRCHISAQIFQKLTIIRVNNAETKF